jgi:hypothetical protein
MKADMELRDLVLEIFRDKGDLTIAGMVRELESRGVRHHRLTVTGYLHAMADAGYLEVRSVPPAKLFILRGAPKRSLWSVVGEAARRIAPTEGRALELTVRALERLLDRPVFLSEVTEAGFTRTSTLRQLGRKERAEATKRLDQCGVDVREGEPMFRAREEMTEDVDRVLAEALLDAMDAQGERPREVRQVALTLDRFG